MLKIRPYSSTDFLYENLVVTQLTINSAFAWEGLIANSNILDIQKNRAT